MTEHVASYSCYVNNQCRREECRAARVAYNTDYKKRKMYLAATEEWLDVFIRNLMSEPA